MNTRRLQGWALILSAVCLLLGRFLPGSGLSHVIAIIGTVLFILGIPAIQIVQRDGVIGWTSLLFLEVAALIALAFELGLNGGPVLALTSAILGTLGRVITGWLTLRRNRFPAWAGWAFLLAGILNLVVGVVDFGSAAVVVNVIAALLDSLALLGYGFKLTQ